MSGHTPGPWTVDAVEHENVDGDRYATSEITTSSGHYIAHVADCGAMADADARLIASAPDLLTACKLARALITMDDGTVDPDVVIDALDAAIKKAGGR